MVRSGGIGVISITEAKITMIHSPILWRIIYKKTDEKVHHIPFVCPDDMYYV
jgi:hypothetical protein